MNATQLLNVIRNCDAVDAAREELSDASPRAVVDAWKQMSGAKTADLKTARHGLLSAVRQRLTAAAA